MLHSPKPRHEFDQNIPTTLAMDTAWHPYTIDIGGGRPITVHSNQYSAETTQWYTLESLPKDPYRQ